MNKKGFLLIETIIVITVLTFGIISVYKLYSKSMTENSLLGTYDQAEYLYKTYYLADEIFDDITEEGVYHYSLDSNYNYEPDSRFHNIPNKNKYRNIMKTLNIETIVIFNKLKWDQLNNYKNDFDPYIMKYMQYSINGNNKSVRFHNLNFTIIAKFKQKKDNIRNDVNIASVSFKL